MSLIEVKDLKKTYFTEGVETPVLHGVSFDIKKGEFVAIMGPSGSGKSTLLHIIGFLDRQTGGEYKFKGKTLDDYSKDEMAHVRNREMGFVFQAFNLLPRASVLENVSLPLLYSEIPHKKWDQKAKKAIKEVGLEHRADYDAVQLSGGEKQRVAIARALVNNAEVVFADEPTGNLDSESGKMVMQYLQKLNDDGHTIVLITHETYTAQHAERIIQIQDGKIIEDAKVTKRKTVKDFLK